MSSLTYSKNCLTYTEKPKVTPEDLLLRNKKEYEQVKNEIENNNKDINFQLRDGRTALMFACCNGNLEIVQYLCDNGAKLDLVENIYGNSALMYAIGHQNTQVAIYLITKGANIHIKNINEDTPLHFATIKGNYSLVKLLHQKGCDLNECNKEYNNPIIFATGNNWIHIVNYLIENNVYLDVCDGDRISLLHMCLGTNMHLDELFLKKTPEEKNNLYKRKLEIVTLILDKDSSFINYYDKNFGTVLNYAVELNRPEFVKLFLEKGANPNINNSLNYSPLYNAVFYNSFEITKLLIDYGANINARYIVSTLNLIHGGKVTLGDSILRTAIKYLASYDIIELLKSKNAIDEREY